MFCKQIKIIFFFGVFSLFLSQVQAQGGKIDSLGNQLAISSQHTSPSVLFAHFDKNVYTNNDDVWFSAYVINSIGSLTNYNTLFVSLVNNADSSVVLQRKFVMSKGLAYGGFRLPDSIFTGNYRFVVNTNIQYLGKPDVEFIQPISIKSTIINPLEASISIFKAYNEETKEGTALLRVLTSNNRFVEGADIRYEIGGGKQIIKKGTAKTSVIGELMIKYPADKITEKTNQLGVYVSAKGKQKYIKFNLPYNEQPKYKLKFYPEGGYLINGLTTRIGFELKDYENSAVKTKLILFQDSEPIDTLISNSIGLGEFYLQPLLGKKYFVKSIDGNENETVDLPVALLQGMGISIRKALANDELIAQVQSNVAMKILVLVHNYKDIFLSAPITLTPDKVKSLRMDLGNVPAGLNTVTLLDSLYKPIAERIFFAHYDAVNHIDIQTDKSVYATREKVTVNLKVLGKNDSSYAALVSVACVQDNRILSRNKKDITSYTYLEHSLGALPTIPLGQKFKDTDYLENILLIKTWRKYKWPTETQTKPDTSKALTSLGFSGVVTKYDKPLKRPMVITTFAGKNLHFFTSDSVGRFSMLYKDVVTTQGNGKVWLNLGDKNAKDYNVVVKDPADDLKPYLKHQEFEESNDKSIAVTTSKGSMLSQAGIKLNEVTITNSTDKFNVSNRCGDYVCSYNVLNCPNHINLPNNRLPVKGQTYKNGYGGGSVVYQGCEDSQFANNLMLINGINMPKEFYISDVANMQEPINFATVFWKDQLPLDKNTATPLTFNTGDLTGKFKIIVQGITEKGVAYGEKDFEVKAP